MDLHELLQYARAGFAGGVFVIFLLEVLLFTIRRRAVHAVGAAMLFCASAVLVARVVIYGDAPVEVSRTATRVVWTSLFLIGGLIGFGLRLAVGKPIGRLTYVVGGFAAIAALLVWPDGPIIGAGHGTIEEWTGNVVMVVELSPTFPLFVLPFVTLLLLDLFLFGRSAKFPEVHQTWYAVLFSSVLLVAGAMNEVAQIVGLYQSTGTVEFALALGVLSLLFVFAGYTSQAYDALERDVELSNSALANTVESLRGLISGLPDLVLVMRSDEVEPYNARAKAALGEGPFQLSDLGANDEVVGALERLFSSATTEATFERLEIKTTAGVEQIDLVVVSAEIDGERVVIANGRTSHERDELERQLRLADRLSSLGTMAAGVAHEINNPIAYIAANLEFCVAELEGDDARVEELEAIQSAIGGTHRIARIVKDLGTFARYESAGSDSPGEVKHALDIALGIARSTLRHSVTINNEVPDGLPLVTCDTGQLSQVLLNFLINAADAMPEGRDASDNCVTVSASRADGVVSVAVIDNGLGMEPDEVEKAFDPFFTTKDVGEGTGLGLSICHTIIERAGGTVRIESEPERGTTITFEIPISRTPVVQITEEVAAAPEGLSLLLIDDDPMVVRSTQRLLGLTYAVVTATSGSAAIEAMKGQDFDAVICDVMMPDMNGLELYDWVTEHKPMLAGRFVYFTGGAIGGSVQEALQTASIPVISKPLNRRQLDEVLVRLKAAS